MEPNKARGYPPTHTHTHTHPFIYIYTYIYQEDTHTHTHAHTHKHTHMHIYIYIYITPAGESGYMMEASKARGDVIENTYTGAKETYILPSKGRGDGIENTFYREHIVRRRTKLAALPGAFWRQPSVSRFVCVCVCVCVCVSVGPFVDAF